MKKYSVEEFRDIVKQHNEMYRSARYPKDFVFTDLLMNADLSGFDMSGLDLRHIRLQGSNLEGANLKGANLDNVDLTRATDLSGAIGI